MDLEGLKSELDLTGRVSTWATWQLIAKVEWLEAGLRRIKMGRVYYSNRTDKELTRLELMVIANAVLKGDV